jgi:hypothetical protein
MHSFPLVAFEFVHNAQAHFSGHSGNLGPHLGSTRLAFDRALLLCRRFYSNAYTDAEKQDAINLFLGNYVPLPGELMADVTMVRYPKPHTGPCLAACTCARAHFPAHFSAPAARSQPGIGNKGVSALCVDRECIQPVQQASGKGEDKRASLADLQAYFPDIAVVVNLSLQVPRHCGSSIRTTICTQVEWRHWHRLNIPIINMRNKRHNGTIPKQCPL